MTFTSLHAIIFLRFALENRDIILVSNRLTQNLRNGLAMPVRLQIKGQV